MEHHGTRCSEAKGANEGAYAVIGRDTRAARGANGTLRIIAILVASRIESNGDRSAPQPYVLIDTCVRDTRAIVMMMRMMLMLMLMVEMTAAGQCAVGRYTALS